MKKNRKLLPSLGLTKHVGKLQAKAIGDGLCKNKFCNGIHSYLFGAFHTLPSSLHMILEMSRPAFMQGAIDEGWRVPCVLLFTSKEHGLKAHATPATTNFFKCATCLQSVPPLYRAW